MKPLPGAGGRQLLVLTAPRGRPGGQGTGLCSPANPAPTPPKSLGPLSAATRNDPPPPPVRTAGTSWGGEGVGVTCAGFHTQEGKGLRRVSGCLGVSRAAGLWPVPLLPSRAGIFLGKRSHCQLPAPGWGPKPDVPPHTHSCRRRHQGGLPVCKCNQPRGLGLPQVQLACPSANP